MGSTTAAVIDIFQNLTSLLQTNDFVVFITVDFTKAFDSVGHKTLMQKMQLLQILTMHITQSSQSIKNPFPISTIVFPITTPVPEPGIFLSLGQQFLYIYTCHNNKQLVWIYTIPIWKKLDVKMCNQWCVRVKCISKGLVNLLHNY